MNIVFAGVRRSTAALLIAFAFAAPPLTAQREPIQKPVVEKVITPRLTRDSAGRTTDTPQPHTSAANVTPAGPSCTLMYERADNMWAARGMPDGGLGKETITLSQGAQKVFVTDWKYEKQRGDDQNRYGSHLRRATNTGQRPISLAVRDGPVLGAPSGSSGASGLIAAGASGALDALGVQLQPGQVNSNLKGDLVAVTCP